MRISRSRSPASPRRPPPAQNTDPVRSTQMTVALVRTGGSRGCRVREIRASVAEDTGARQDVQPGAFATGSDPFRRANLADTASRRGDVTGASFEAEATPPGGKSFAAPVRLGGRVRRRHGAWHDGRAHRQLRRPGLRGGRLRLRGRSVGDPRAPRASCARKRWNAAYFPSARPRRKPARAATIAFSGSSRPEGRPPCRPPMSKNRGETQ